VSGYLEKSSRGHSTVGRYYSGQDPKTGFSRFIGGTKSSKGRKAANSAEKSIFERAGIAIKDYIKEVID
jgi:hypothetical protein